MRPREPQTDLFRSAAPPAGTDAALPGWPGPPRRAGPAPPDAAERRRILEELHTNLLVEAGAGAGKTTQLVDRMAALVRSGVAVERIAAVTFTRKAAAELRERFQTRLEEDLRHTRAAAAEGATAVLDLALREIDRAFIGTIHSFCARLLRERPLDAGIDPDFRETFAVEQERLRRDQYATHVERLAAAGDPSLADLARVGLQPSQLLRLFEEMTEYGDVEFPAEDVARPDPADARRRLSALVDEALAAMPAEEPALGWDRLQSAVRRLRFYRDVVGWDDDAGFLHVLAETLAAMPRVTENRWAPVTEPSGVREISRRFREFVDAGGEGGRVLRQWWAHRYPIAVSFARRAARAFEEERLRTGSLSFQDLLQCTARLLRSNRSARADLGERYRYILVDEFQDTDPLQAEILFLLASPPDGAEHWHQATPRPGALFVVGDPKQSIYRFRRADITIYNQVKQRFARIGDIVRLTANFRSGPPLEKLVDSVFRERFPAEATEEQAAFAPLQVTKPAGPGQGVFAYRVQRIGTRSRTDELARIDAGRVASWIAARIAAGERKPGDFLILTRVKRDLVEYAREIEARNLPLQVTGGGIGIEEEMAEFRLLLASLAEPGDATRLIAVLVGLFFGLDYDQLAEHVLDRGGRFDFTEPPARPVTAVERALVRLNGFWNLTRSGPADVVVAELVHRLGLLPFAAAGELGESRAGALFYVVEAVRAAALAGDASLTGAIAGIDAALEAKEAEAPLEPGRTDVIRIMNLHQAKGLEADVVVLAAPFGERDHPVERHVTRREADHAEGWVVVTEGRWRRNDTVLARPLDWDAHEAAEREFRRAEDDRLLYVAATRAREELVVARYEVPRESPWAPLYPWLDAEFPSLDMPAAQPPPRARLEVSAAAVTAEIERVDDARSRLARPTWSAAPVRARVKPPDATGRTPAERDGPADPATAAEEGAEWGKLVHAGLEAAGRGRTGDALRSICRAHLLALDDPDIGADGEPVRLDELLGIVESVTRSPLWHRAAAADARFVEVPFSLALRPAEFAGLAGLAQRSDPASADLAGLPVEVIDGVIDLVFRENGGWIVVDYKSDRAGPGIDPDTRRQYRAQVDLYADCWQRLTGEAVTERVILFTTGGASESW